MHCICIYSDTETVTFQDCNKGLIGQVINSIHRHMILRLRKTYRRLTVDSLARRLRIGDDLPKAERVVAILDDMVRVLSVYSTRIRLERKKLTESQLH